MKTTQLILFLALLCYCFSQTTDDRCETEFLETIKNKCAAINTGCSYDITSEKCIQTSSCSAGNGDEDKCKTLIPSSFHEKKCKYNAGTCEEVAKECRDYNKANPYSSSIIRIDGDTCESLSHEAGKTCVLTNTGACSSFYTSCSSFTTSVTCTGKILANGVQICKWGKATDASTEDSCFSELRNCYESIHNPSKDTCSQLKISDTSNTPKKACIYDEDNKRCSEEYILCDNTDYNNGQSSCDGKRPLTTNKKTFDYSKICTWNSALTPQKCDVSNVKCDDYSGYEASANFCKNLPTTDGTKKRCAYNSDDEKCYEEYSSCQAYNSEEGKTREVCEGIKLEDANKECVYIYEEDICQERTIYETCESYTEDDKNICESIISPTTHRHCILDKDSKCTERTFNCTDATNEFDCLYFSNATDKNKICFYDHSNDRCYEEYKRCEDYNENDINRRCSSIHLFSQKKCESVSDKCKAFDKECSDAKTKEECQLIAQIGVSNPDKFVCDYDYRYYDYDNDGIIDYTSSNPTCFQNYKYCSDYRGSDRNICIQIKPYNKEGSEIIDTSKCKYESGVGCQRVPKDCSDADGNPMLCAKISPLIKDNNVKYCTYINGDCKEHYKTCESYEGSVQTDCENIVPQNYIHKPCRYEYDSSEGKSKCITKKECSLFTPVNKKTICEEIGYNCTYTSDGECKSQEKDYDDFVFYKESEDNEATCKAFEFSDPYLNISLNEEKTGCDWIYKKQWYSYDSSYDAKPSSSQFIPIGIHLFIALLCFLI